MAGFDDELHSFFGYKKYSHKRTSVFYIGRIFGINGEFNVIDFGISGFY